MTFLPPSDSTSDQHLFGGKTLLLGGDFGQILPVIPCGSKADIIDASLCSFPLWSSLTIFFLHQNTRLATEGLTDLEEKEFSEFSSWILQVGDGKTCDLAACDDDDAAYIKIPTDLLINPGSNSIKTLIDAIYDDLLENQYNPSYFRERAIITPKNRIVTEINNFVLSSFPGSERIYFISDTICSSSIDSENLDLLYPTEFFNELEFPGLPTHALALKIGSPIMSLRNMNLGLGLCNGTRMIITHLADKVIQARIITGNQVGETVFIPRIILSATETRWPLVFKRRQFPVRICYAMTINKSQGQSLKKVGLYLPEPVFAHGQLYVALSRVTSKNGLKILIDNAGNAPNNYAKNIVYQDILSKLLSGFYISLTILNSCLFVVSFTSGFHIYLFLLSMV